MVAGGIYTLLIIRHLESEKNILNQFSSTDDVEQLTAKGLKQGEEVAKAIYDFIVSNGLSVTNVYCANSRRAKLTATYIAKVLGVNIMAFDELRSNNSGELKGKAEGEAWEINPLFMKQLSLFRAGIFSSYDFVKISEREDKHEFEFRVMQCIESILKIDSGTLQVIVLHHSSLTATIIYYARKYYNYPMSFYGHIACELGNIYLIDNKDILLCNEPASKLLEVKI